MLYQGDLRLLLSVPGGPGAVHTLPDGTVPQPGGWNRIMLQVPDLEAAVAGLRKDGVPFRTDIITSVGTKQAMIDDPSANPIELYEPLRAEARLSES